ncbi:MAG: hypothetical protein H0U76_05110 [Ktedonobacteraceae bacterium]|nr:hypothetical protein [Ktedonobacteraceae bacterium]
MKDRDTKEKTNSNQHLLVKTHMHVDLFLNSVEIDEVLGRLCTLFSGRVGIADRETLTFCLRHIFYNVNQLYTLFLPELTKCSLGKASAGQKHLHIHTMPTRNMPVQNLMIQYSIWSLLQEIEATLERLEPLCQLVTSATTNILNELDRTCSIKNKREQARPGEIEDETPTDHARESQGQTQQADDDEWQLGLIQMREKTNAWLNSYEKQLSLSVQFAILAPMIPALPQIDAAFALLLKSSCAIFRDILPDFQASGTDEDEKGTTLLLDIIQRCDQIVLQIGILAQPLYVLTGQYTLETTMQ